MEITEIIRTVTSLSFWQEILQAYISFGPAAAVLLAALESIVPGLPFIAITALNVAAHGYLSGFFYSWLGSSLGSGAVLLFYRFVFKKFSDRLAPRSERVRKARAFMADFDPAVLLLLLCFPVTPSSFFNFAFGISDYPLGRYILSLFASKLVIVGLFVLFGEAVADFWHDPLKFFIICLLMIVICFIGSKLRKKYMGSK